MPTRFRRTFTLFPGVKVNVSKGGISISVGKSGFTLNFSKRGVRQTVGLPGSGISHTSYLYKAGDDEDEKEREGDSTKQAAPADEAPRRKKRRRPRAENRKGASSPCGFFVFTFLAAFLIYLGGVLLGLLPSNLVSELFKALTEWARQAGL